MLLPRATEKKNGASERLSGGFADLLKGPAGGFADLLKGHDSPDPPDPGPDDPDEPYDLPAEIA